MLGSDWSLPVTSSHSPLCLIVPGSLSTSGSVQHRTYTLLTSVCSAVCGNFVQNFFVLISAVLSAMSPSLKEDVYLVRSAYTLRSIEVAGRRHTFVERPSVAADHKHDQCIQCPLRLPRVLQTSPIILFPNKACVHHGCAYNLSRTGVYMCTLLCVQTAVAVAMSHAACRCSAAS